MRWRQVIVLYVVLAALAAEYWLVERQPRPPENTQPARGRFLDIQPGQLREIRLLRGGRSVVWRRSGGGWAVVEPPGAAIPPDLIAAFMSALSEAEEIERVAPATDAKTYGLDERASRVEIVPETGEQVTVTLGETNPTGTAVYARRGEAPHIVLIGRNVRYYEDLIFQALPIGRVPAARDGAPVGG